MLLGGVFEYPRAGKGDNGLGIRYFTFRYTEEKANNPEWTDHNWNQANEDKDNRIGQARDWRLPYKKHVSLPNSPFF